VAKGDKEDSNEPGYDEDMYQLEELRGNWRSNHKPCFLMTKHFKEWYYICP